MQQTFPNTQWKVHSFTEPANQKYTSGLLIYVHTYILIGGQWLTGTQCGIVIPKEIACTVETTTHFREISGINFFLVDADL